MATKPMEQAWRGWTPRLARADWRARSATILRDPLTAFLIVGAALFLAYYWVALRNADPVRYTPDVEAALVADLEMVTGRKATPADRARLQKNWITEELLFREAIERRMHLTDGETRKRLTDKVRYLIAGAPAEPSEEAIINHYSSNLDRYRAEPKTSFSQLFRSAEPADAAALLAALNRGESVPADDFWLGRDFPNYGDSMVRGIFGQAFVDRLKAAADGQWFGPVRSSRGWHFVRKTGSAAPALIPYRDIREQVRNDLMMAETSAVIDRATAKLKEKFDVVVVR